MKVTIIIPVFNEEKTIQHVVKKLHPLTFSGFTKEIIIVDDGSSDKTFKNTVAAIKGKKNILLLSHKENKGKGAAIRTAIKKAKGEYIIIQDADLEYDPAYIPTLLMPIKKGSAQVVYGTRLKRLPNIRKEERALLFLLHYFGNRFLSLVTSILYGQWVTDIETGYKLFPKKALRNIRLHAKGFEFEPEITVKLLRCGYKITEIPITTNPRGYKEGKKLHTIKDGSKALWHILKYRFISLK